MQSSIRLGGRNYFVVISLLLSSLSVKPAAFPDASAVAPTKQRVNYGIVIERDQSLKGAVTALFMQDFALRVAYAQAVEQEPDHASRAYKRGILDDIDRRGLINEELRKNTPHSIRFINTEDYDESYEHSLTFKDGDTLQALSSRGGIATWNVKTGEYLQTTRLEGALGKMCAACTALACSPDGKKIAIDCLEKVIIRDKNGETLPLFQKFPSQNRSLSVAFNHDGSVCAFGIQGRVTALHLSKKNFLHRSEIACGSSTNPIHALAFNHEETKLAIASDRGVYLWDMKLQERSGFVTPLEAYESVAFSHDGTIIAAGSHPLFGIGSGTLRLYNSATKQYLFKIQTSYRNTFSSLAFGPDDSMIAASFKGGGIELWLLDHTKVIAQLSSEQVLELHAALKTGSIKSDVYDDLCQRIPCLGKHATFEIKKDPEVTPAE